MFRVHRHLGDELYVTMSSDAGYQFHYAYPLPDVPYSTCYNARTMLHSVARMLACSTESTGMDIRVPWHFNFRNALLRKHSIYIASYADATNSDTRRV